MRVQVFDGSAALAAAGADVVHAGIAEFAGRALGVATGSTPLGLYAELSRRCAQGLMDPGALGIVALDEYLGVGPEHPGSYATYVRDRIARPLGIPDERVAVPDGLQEPGVACPAFEASIRRLGCVGVQVAGIGSNGHLGFNEPGTPFDSRTHIVQLSEQTRADNQAVFGTSPVPRFALTQGISTILDARRILLLATGAGKAEAVRRALTEAPDVDCPASAVQLHPDVVVLLDRDAASALPASVFA